MTRILFLSPEVPASTGNGLAMRAGATLRALATLGTVDVEVIGRRGEPEPAMRQ